MVIHQIFTINLNKIIWLYAITVGTIKELHEFPNQKKKFFCVTDELGSYFNEGFLKKSKIRFLGNFI